MEEITQVITKIRGELSLRQFARVMKVSATVVASAEKTGNLSKKMAKKYSALSEKPLEFFIR